MFSGRFGRAITTIPHFGRRRMQTGVLVMAAATSYIYATGLATPTTQAESSSPANNRLEFWQKRWESGKTRWHKTHVHPSLQQYCDDKLIPAEEFPAGGARILVPLCGKTVDMQYLATKRKVAQVVGVDGVRAAVEQFAQEHPDLNVRSVGRADDDGFEKWTGESITLLVGDFFDLNEKTMGFTFDAAWDRAAMVAIHPSLREQYVQKIGALLNKPNGRVLLSTYVRPNGDMETGPPFSIDEDEVRRLFEGQPWVKSVELLDVHSAAIQEPWYKAIFLYLRMGMNAKEKIFLITTK